MWWHGAHQNILFIMHNHCRELRTRRVTALLGSVSQVTRRQSDPSTRKALLSILPVDSPPYPYFPHVRKVHEATQTPFGRAAIRHRESVQRSRAANNNKKKELFRAANVESVAGKVLRKKSTASFPMSRQGLEILCILVIPYQTMEQ